METVLIIEDDETYRSMIISSLEKQGYRVLEADNGASGFQLAKTHHPDLVVTDIVMEQMDGYGVLSSIREDSDLSPTPVIMITGWSSKGGMRHGMAMGADDYIPKPFRASELLASVRAQLDKRRNLIDRADQQLKGLRTNISTILPHELRTPLSIILAFSDILATQSRLMDADETSDMAIQINAAARRLNRVAENLTVYSDLDALSADESLRLLARQKRTDRTGDIIRKLSVNKSHEYDRTIDLSLDIVNSAVNMSRAYLTKMIGEIVDNAFKFSEPGSAVSVTSVFKDTHLIVTICDEGVGMNKADISSIDPYVQFDRETQEQQGIGFGLAIAHRTAHVHGAEISIQSAKGKGTTVEIRIPGEAG